MDKNDSITLLVLRIVYTNRETFSSGHHAMLYKAVKSLVASHVKQQSRAVAVDGLWTVIHCFINASS